MKRIGKAAVAVVGMATILACGHLFAQMQSGSYRSANAASIGQERQQDFSPNAKYEAAAYASLSAELAEGEGRLEVQSFCMTCHSTRYITMQPALPAATWDAEVTKMIKAYGAPIPEETANKITAYLQAHYTAENRKE
jgi:cytochrome c5